MSKRLLVLIVVTTIVVTISPLFTSHPQPIAAQDDKSYTEAPMLIEHVADGNLPPVEERLPDNPAIIVPNDSIGEYGGIWHRAWQGTNDFHAFGRITYDPVLRWPTDPNDPVEANLAESWEFSDDGTELTLHFREGLHWSDGAPFTVDDVIFWWEAIETDTNITPAIHGEWQIGGEPMQLEKIDDTSITLKFAAPNGLAETVGLAFHGNQWPLGFERFGFYAPRHYLEQFHPAYSDTGSYELFEEKAFDYNIERPVMTAWKIAEYEPDTTLLIAERNPYYWKVDTEGQQLPYIDYVYFHRVDGTPEVNEMGLAGELSMQARWIDLLQYPSYLESAESGDYHMLLWPQAQASSATLWFNQSYPDEQYRTLFQDLRFRQAMSHAIDRIILNEIIYVGQGVPRTITVVPDSPYYQPELELSSGEYDPALAVSLLEDIGLVQGEDGFFNFPDGTDIILSIETSVTTTGMQDTIEFIQLWWSDVGIKSEIEVSTREEFWSRAGNNEVMVSTWITDRGLVPMVDPIYQFPFDERSWMAPAFGLWYKTEGEEGMEPTTEFRVAMELYDEYKLTTNFDRQLEIGQELVRMATENLWTIGTVGLVPNAVVVKDNFMNVLESHTADWIIMTPGTMHPEQFYFLNGEN